MDKKYVAKNIYHVTLERVAQLLREGRTKVAQLITQQARVDPALTLSSDDDTHSQPDVRDEKHSTASPTDTSQRSFWKNDLTARIATLIFCLVVFFAIWLWDNVPLVSVGIMLVLSIVQTLRHSWIAGSTWRNHVDPNIRWWHISYAAMWGGLIGWFVFVLTTLQPVATSPTSSLASFWSIVWFTCGSVVLVAFSALNGMFYLSGVATPEWPWHVFKQAADDTWKQRWVMVFVGWMLLVVLFVSAVGIESFSVAGAFIR